jgi:hypothetical protein
MKRFKTRNVHEEIIFFIRNWIELLSDDEFEKACSLLDAPESGSDDIAWNAAILKEAFLNYGSVGRMPIINSPYQMDLDTEKIDFYEYDDSSGYAVDYDIPLDGAWGDLTAQFSFKIIGDAYTVTLEDVHVL